MLLLPPCDGRHYIQSLSAPPYEFVLLDFSYPSLPLLCEIVFYQDKPKSCRTRFCVCCSTAARRSSGQLMDGCRLKVNPIRRRNCCACVFPMTSVQISSNFTPGYNNVPNRDKSGVNVAEQLAF